MQFIQQKNLKNMKILYKNVNNGEIKNENMLQINIMFQEVINLSLEYVQLLINIFKTHNSDEYM